MSVLLIFLKLFLGKFQSFFSGSSILSIYKTFVRSRFDYANIIYDQAYNSTFHDKLEYLQYNACLATTGAIRGTSTAKICQELGLQFLKYRRWSTSYLFNIIANLNCFHDTRFSYKIPPIKVRHDYFKN